MREFLADMRIAKYSETTIHDRMEVLRRLRAHIDKPLVDATAEDLRDFQKSFSHLAPASVNVYTRHVRAFYRWAYGRGLIPEDPSASLTVPRVAKGRPHPTTEDDLRTIFACTTGWLRMAYVLAAFAGLRRAEICRLERHDLDLSETPTAFIHGKGRKTRIVPLIPPVVAELLSYGLPPRGWVLTKDGQPLDPERLSIDSHYHLAGLGIQTTLHSLRHSFATQALRATRDPMFVRDLLGHESVATMEIYAESSMTGAHERLAPMSRLAPRLLSGEHRLYIVGRERQTSPRS